MECCKYDVEYDVAHDIAYDVATYCAVSEFVVSFDVGRRQI